MTNPKWYANPKCRTTAISAKTRRTCGRSRRNSAAEFHRNSTGLRVRRIKRRTCVLRVAADHTATAVEFHRNCGGGHATAADHAALAADHTPQLARGIVVMVMVMVLNSAYTGPWSPTSLTSSVAPAPCSARARPCLDVWWGEPSLVPLVASL